MISFRLTGICLGIFSALPFNAQALDWKETTVSVTTTPFQTEQEVVFKFTNRGAKPVAIRELETSCSCVQANSDAKIYLPGVSGKVTAKFIIGDRGGLYERIVTVVTDEPGEPTRLVLKIEVPQVVSVAPRSVDWQLNAEPHEQIIDLNSAPGLEIIFSNAQPTSDVYTAELESIEAGKHYRLHLRPKSTANPTSAAIRLYGREKSGHEVVISAYASVH